MSVPRYFVRVGPEVRGPYDVAQLRQLGEVGVVGPESDAAVRGEGPWFRLATLPEQAEIFPPRTVHAFKPTDFPVINDATTPPVDFREIIAQAQTAGPLLRPNHPPALAAHFGKKASAEPNEVEAMVREVQAREAEFAPPAPPPPKWKPSRRLVLVVSLAIAGNGLLAGILTYYDGWNHNHSQVISIGLAIIFNGGLVIFYHQLPKE